MLRIKTGKKSGNHNSIFSRGNRRSWIHTIPEYCILTWCQNRQELKERLSRRKWPSQNGSPEICGRRDTSRRPRGESSLTLSTCWLLRALRRPTGRQREGASLSQRAHRAQNSEGLATEGREGFFHVPRSPLKKGQPGPMPDPGGFLKFFQLKEGVLFKQLQLSPNQRSGLWKSPALWWGQVWAHRFTHR